MNKKPRVVFTFVEAGFGHIVPMESLYQAFCKKYGDKCDVIKSYIFSQSQNKAVKSLGESIINHSKRASKNFLYNRFEAFSYAFSSKLTLWGLDCHFGNRLTALEDEVVGLNADLMVSSYYLPSHAVARANKKGLSSTLVATYSPDVYIYPAWDRRCDAFIVNNENAYRQALKKGFDKKVVKQIPFILKQSVLEVIKDKAYQKKELGLQDKFTILITGGAYGSKGTEKLISALMGLEFPFNLIVTCGTDEKLKEKLQEKASKINGNISLHVLGFTEKLPEFMVASDVIVGKGSSNTVMEAQHLGIPMIINSAINRLEEISANYYHKNKIAIKEFNPKKVAKIIEKAYKCGTWESFELAPYGNLHQTGQDACADLLFDLLKKKFPTLK